MSPLSRFLVGITLIGVFVCAAALGVAQTQQGITDEALENIEFDVEAEYYVRLINGDVVSGPVTESGSDSVGSFIRIKTPFGRARVYASEISWISLLELSYRARNRGLILPTANAIKGDHYIALVEGVLPMIGVGISDFLSVTAGRTLIPIIGWENQFSTVNIKGTVYEGENGLVEGGKQIYAFGINGAWMNDVNFIGHIYAVATFIGKRTSVSSIIHAKVAGKDLYTVNSGTLANPFSFPFQNGTIGVAFMMDVRFPEMHDLHFLGELWNADLTRPAQSGLFLGLRQANTAVTFDFGLTIIPGPNVIPAIAISWTPW